jgi:hypothetical protein
LDNKAAVRINVKPLNFVQTPHAGRLSKGRLSQIRGRRVVEMTRQIGPVPIVSRVRHVILIALAIAGFVASGPASAQEADRVAAWRQDIDVLLTDFLERDKTFSPEAEAEGRRRLTALKGRIAELSDYQVALEIRRAVALGGNAHTQASLMHRASGSELSKFPLRYFPIRVYWFEEGLYVVKAANEYREAAGKRVAGIGQSSPEALMPRIAELIAGNEQWVKYLSPLFLLSPEVLYDLGVIESMDACEFTLEDETGASVRLELRPRTPEVLNENKDIWCDLSPFWEDPGEWVHVVPADREKTPLYLRDPVQFYWSHFDPGSKTLYLQYNRAGAMRGPEDKRIGEFFLETIAFLEERDVERLIIDLRFNTGGNLMLARNHFKTIGAMDKLNDPKKLYVITGRATFSAGLYHAAALRQDTRATFAGEPVGDYLDFWAEGRPVVLPNSGIRAIACAGFHSYSPGVDPRFKEHLYMDLEVESLEPHVPAPLRWSDYLAGRDPVLEAIAAIR